MVRLRLPLRNTTILARLLFYNAYPATNCQKLKDGPLYLIRLHLMEKYLSLCDTLVGTAGMIRTQKVDLARQKLSPVQRRISFNSPDLDNSS